MEAICPNEIEGVTLQWILIYKQKIGLLMRHIGGGNCRQLVSQFCTTLLSVTLLTSDGHR